MAVSGKWIEGIGPETPVEEAARRSLEPRLAAVARYLPLATHLAEHDVEHVHRLRVATRRACAALKLYKEFLPRKPARWLKRRLRKIRKAAGDARDLDVLSQRLHVEYGEKSAPILEVVRKERDDVHHAITRVAARCSHDDGYVRKTAKLINGIRSRHHENGAAQGSRTFGPWAETQVALIEARFFETLPNESSRLASLHEFRIRAKALRYAIELVASAFPAELRDSAYPLIESVQERLGRVQDVVTARGRFEAWTADDDYASLHPLLAELVRSETEQLNESVREFHSWWDEGKIDALRQSIPIGATRASEAHGEFERAITDSRQEADPQTQPAP